MEVSALSPLKVVTKFDGLQAVVSEFPVSSFHNTNGQRGWNETDVARTNSNQC